MDDDEDPRTATKRTLWANVLALMEAKYGRENLTRLARDTGIGPGTATRMKEQRTSVGIDVLEKIAGKFKVTPWQLLAPNLGADLYLLGADRRLMPVPVPANVISGINVTFDERGSAVDTPRRRGAN